jgi:hypothetical protein
MVIQNEGRVGAAIEDENRAKKVKINAPGFHSINQLIEHREALSSVE